MVAAASSTALCFLLLLALSHAATFEISNSCPYTVWAAAVPGGGIQLNRGQSWTINVNPGTTGGRIWGRTGCSFDSSGRGSCLTGDCGGLLECQGYGSPPNTLAEFSLNQFNNFDFFDISNVDGFNVPMEFSPTDSSCRRVRCAADIVGQCPSALRMPRGCSNPCTALTTDEYCCTADIYSPNTGISMEINIRACAGDIVGQCPDVLTAASAGCYNPCTVFETEEYCCNSGACNATDYSRFFKELCPDAYSYPKPDASSAFTCPDKCQERLHRLEISKRCRFVLPL